MSFREAHPHRSLSTLHGSSAQARTSIWLSVLTGVWSSGHIDAPRCQGFPIEFLLDWQFAFHHSDLYIYMLTQQAHVC